MINDLSRADTAGTWSDPSGMEDYRPLVDEYNIPARYDMVASGNVSAGLGSGLFTGRARGPVFKQCCNGTLTKIPMKKAFRDYRTKKEHTV